MSDAEHDLRVRDLTRALLGCLKRSEISPAEKLQVLALLVMAFADGEVDYSKLGGVA